MAILLEGEDMDRQTEDLGPREDEEDILQALSMVEAAVAMGLRQGSTDEEGADMVPRRQE